MFTSSIRMGNKSDFCDFSCGMDFGTKWADLSILETADFLAFSYTKFIAFTQNDTKNKKFSMNSGFVA